MQCWLFMNTHFVTNYQPKTNCTNTSTRSVCLVNPNICAILLFHQIFVNIFNITGINDIIADRKIVHVLLKPCFFMLSAVKSFEVLPKLNRSALFKNILLQMDRFTQHWHAKSCWMHCCVDSNKIFFVVLLIFIKYLASAVIVESFSPSAGSSPRTRVFFFPLSVSTEELFSTK